MVGLEKLTKQEIREIIEYKLDLLSSLNLFELGTIDDIMAETYSEVDMYNQVFTLLENDDQLSCGQLASLVGSNRFIVHNWVNCGRKPFLLAKPRLYSRTQFDPLKDCESIVKLMAISSAVRRSVKEKKFRFEFGSKGVARYFVIPFFDVFSTVPEFSDLRGGVKIEFSSSPFLDYFNEHTINNQVIPWHLLDSLEKKSTYFQYFFLKRGGFAFEGSRKNPKGRIGINFKGNPSLRNDFGVLLFDLGLIPQVHSEYVDIGDYSDLQKILRSGWCLDPEKKTGLNLIAKRRKSDRRVNHNQFLNLIRMYQSGEIAQADAIKVLSQKLGFSSSRTADYLSLLEGTRVPKKVRRFLEIVELSNQGPNRDLVVALYNQGVSPALSRRYAEQISCDTYQQIKSGKLVHFQKSELDFYVAVDVIAWLSFGNNLVEDKLESKVNYSGQLSDKLEVARKNNEHTYYDLEVMFNMYVGPESLTSDTLRRRKHFYLYQMMRAHPRFEQTVSVVDGRLCVKDSNIDLAEMILGAVHRKKLRFSDALGETEKYFSS
ncbi:hypothetical protein HN587_03770 [Candidatus Woesearchaeota archaeon]|nr:hypothetical protein [Candidatus Woesearchaeota archaeon]